MGELTYKPIDAAVLGALMPKIQARTVVVGECLEWTGGTTPKGYGSIKLHGVGNFRTHRVAYVAAKGPIPDGLVIDHLCKNRVCCNPDHLEAVTIWENTKRGECFSAKHAAATHCRHGHEFTPENTDRLKTGARVCRTCRLGQLRIRRARNRLAKIASMESAR